MEVSVERDPESGLLRKFTVIVVKEWVSALSKGNGVYLAFRGASLLISLVCCGGNYLSSLRGL